MASTQTDLVLHAGGPKTGGSSIQRIFDGHNSPVDNRLLSSLPFRLFTREVSRSDFGTRRNQGKLLSFVWDNQRSTTDVNRWKSDLKDQIATNTDLCDLTFVFSTERACAPQLNMNKAKQVAQFLQSIELVRQVLYYVRPFLSLSLSLGLQQVKAFAMRPIHGSLFRRLHKIKSTHIVDKHAYFATCYPTAELAFRLFNRNELLNGDVRLDFAKQLGTSLDLIELLRLELSTCASANESIDLHILKIITKIYNDLNIPEQSLVPSLFNQFISLGCWSGPKCTLADLFTDEQISVLYQQSAEEIDAISSFAKQPHLSHIANMAGLFSQILHRTKASYRTTQSDVDISQYWFKITLGQRYLVEEACRRLEYSDLTSCDEHQFLQQFLNESIDTQYRAVKVLPIIYSAGHKLSSLY